MDHSEQRLVTDPDPSTTDVVGAVLWVLGLVVLILSVLGAGIAMATSEVPLIFTFRPPPAQYVYLRAAIAVWALSGGILFWRLLRFRRDYVCACNLVWALATVALSVVWIVVRPDSETAPIAPMGFLVVIGAVSSAVSFVEARRPNMVLKQTPRPGIVHVAQSRAGRGAA